MTDDKPIGAKTDCSVLTCTMGFCYFKPITITTTVRQLRNQFHECALRVPTLLVDFLLMYFHDLVNSVSNVMPTKAGFVDPRPYSLRLLSPNTYLVPAFQLRKRQPRGKSGIHMSLETVARVSEHEFLKTENDI